MPQLKKAWTTGQTDDISMNMLLVLASGLALWVAYGVLQRGHRHYSSQCHQPGADRWARVLEVAADFLVSAPAKRRHLRHPRGRLTAFGGTTGCPLSVTCPLSPDA